VQQAIEDDPSGMMSDRLSIGLFNLTQDLRFSKDHGVQTGGYPKKVLNSFIGPQNINLRQKVLRALLNPAGPMAQQFPDRPLRLFRSKQEFNPVAGGQEEGFCKPRQRGRSILGYKSGQAFPQFHGSGIMIKAEDNDFQN
jgi:hypothetical protein